MPLLTLGFSLALTDSTGINDTSAFDTTGAQTTAAGEDVDAEGATDMGDVANVSTGLAAPTTAAVVGAATVDDATDAPSRPCTGVFGRADTFAAFRT